MVRRILEIEMGATATGTQTRLTLRLIFMWNRPQNERPNTFASLPKATLPQLVGH